MKIGLYAGSFDPITRGHMDVISQVATLFDELHIAVGYNPNKNGLFNFEHRCELIDSAIKDYWGIPPIPITISSFSDIPVTRYAKSVNATHLVRGLRQASDFDDEFRYHGVCQRLDPDLIMVHIICQETFLHVSSSTARELAFLKEDISWLVTPSVEQALKNKF